MFSAMPGSTAMSAGKVLIKNHFADIPSMLLAGPSGADGCVASIVYVASLHDHQVAGVGAATAQS